MKTRLATILLVSAVLVFASPVLAAPSVKIGVIYPLNGGAGAEGRELRAGAELAAEIANAGIPEISMDTTAQLIYPFKGF